MGGARNEGEWSFSGKLLKFMGPAIKRPSVWRLRGEKRAEGEGDPSLAGWVSGTGKKKELLTAAGLLGHLGRNCLAPEVVLLTGPGKGAGSGGEQQGAGEDPIAPRRGDWPWGLY